MDVGNVLNMFTRREFLTHGPLLAHPKHTLEFTEVVRRSNLIQQILKHDPDSGRVYTADVYRVSGCHYWLILGELYGPIRGLKAAFIAAESHLSRFRYTDSAELAQELARIQSSEHSRFLDEVIRSIDYCLE